MQRNHYNMRRVSFQAPLAEKGKEKHRMSSILEEFAYGNVSPEAQFFKKDSAYGRALDCVSRSEQKLLERLGAEDRKIFEAYADMQGEVNRLTAVKNLVYGFRLGLTMTAEAFTGLDSLCAGEDGV